MSEKGKSKAWALFAILIMLTSALSFGGGYKWAEATLPTADGVWGQWFRDAYVWVSTKLHLDYTTANRVLITDSGKNATTDADLTWVGGDTLQVTNVSANDVYTSSLYVNGEKYYPEMPVSFTIWNDTGTIYSRNEHTGAVSTGANAATVANAAITSSSRGEVVLKGILSISSSINMKSGVSVKIDEVDITADVDGFVFDGTLDSRLYGGNITVTSAVYTHATVKLLDTSVKAHENTIENLYIHLPVNQGYGVALTSISAFGISDNTFENIKINHGKQGFRLTTAVGASWIGANKFHDIPIYNTAEYGFLLRNDGDAIGYNYFDYVYTETQLAASSSTFGFNCSGSFMRLNTFVACRGDNLGATSYFIDMIGVPTIDAIKYNNFISCHQSAVEPGQPYGEWGTWIDINNGISTTNLNKNTIIVSKQGSYYDKLSDAQAAITTAGDASASNRYTILVLGKIDETVDLGVQSYVDVIGIGGDITYTNNAANNMLSVGNVVESRWSGLTLRRAGNPGAGQYVVSVTGNSPSSVRFENCRFINELTKTSSYGVYISSGSPSFIDCVATGGAATGGHGWRILGTAAPTIISCTGNGGAATLSHGWSILSSATFTVESSIGVGGGVGTDCYGFQLATGCIAKFISCTGTGGSGGAGCFGWIISNAAPTLDSCTGYGGAGGANSDGWYISDGSSPTLNSCTGYGGATSYCKGFNLVDGSAPYLSNCIGVSSGASVDSSAYAISGSSSPILVNCKSGFVTYSTSFSYLSANNGRFRPYGTHPYQVIGAFVNVASATGGATLKIGSSIGGNECAQGITLASTGYKYFSFNTTEVAANAYLYATPSGAAADASFTIYYVVARNYGTNYGLYLNTYGNARITGGTYLSNGASDAVYIDSVSVGTLKWEITGAHIETLDSVGQESINAQAAIGTAPIYLCSLVGSTTNITANAGTAVGTNIQITP